jgi:hypothetical protein
MAEDHATRPARSLTRRQQANWPTWSPPSGCVRHLLINPLPVEASISSKSRQSPSAMREGNRSRVPSDQIVYGVSGLTGHGQASTRHKNSLRSVRFWGFTGGSPRWGVLYPSHAVLGCPPRVTLRFATLHFARPAAGIQEPHERGTGGNPGVNPGPPSARVRR